MCAARGAELEAGLRHFSVRRKAQDDTRAPGFFRGLPCHSLSGKADLVKKDGFSWTPACLGTRRASPARQYFLTADRFRRCRRLVHNIRSWFMHCQAVAGLFRNHVTSCYITSPTALIEQFLHMISRSESSPHQQPSMELVGPSSKQTLQRIYAVDFALE